MQNEVREDDMNAQPWIELLIVILRILSAGLSC